MPVVTGAATPYLVEAIRTDGRGRFRAELETRRAAVLSARHLRQNGFEVTVTGPDGEPVDDTIINDGAAD